MRAPMRPLPLLSVATRSTSPRWSTTSCAPVLVVTEPGVGYRLNDRS